MKTFLFLTILLNSCLVQAFSENETCEYDVEIMGFTAGRIKTSIVTQIENNQKQYVLTNEIKTSGIIAKFYTLETLSKSISLENLSSLIHESFVKENKKEKTVVEKIDYKLKMYEYNHDQKIAIDADKIYQDQTSLYYFIKKTNWKETSEKLVNLINSGSIDTITLTKADDSGGFFKIKATMKNNKKNYFWVDKNSNNIVKMEVETNGGTILSKLDKCQ